MGVFLDTFAQAYQIAYEFQRGILFYVTFPIAVVGIFCNILGLTVLSRDDTMNPTTSLMLRQLAATDVLNILFILPVSFMLDINGPGTYNNIVKPFLYYIFFPLINMTFTATVWIEVFLSGERYIAICYPLHINRISTIGVVRVAVSIVWISAILLGLPIFFESPITNVDDSGVKQVIWLANKTYKLIYYKIVIPVINMFIPAVLLIFFTTRMLSELRQAFSEKLKLASADAETVKNLSSKQRRTTLTLVIIVVIFCMSQLMVFLNYVISSLPVTTPSERIYKVINIGLVGVDSFAGVLESTLNFFVFFLTGQRFRQILREALGCKE
jgi:hypothetical protein